MTRAAYLVLLAIVGVGRLLELRHSARNQSKMVAQGATLVPEPHYSLIVAIHSGVLVSAALEVWFLKRPFFPALAIPVGILFLCANALRWWVIRTLSGQWNVQIMDSALLGVVTAGPYRWVRHPNYVAVIMELFSLPMIHAAWITAIWGTLAYSCVLIRRVATEESVLLANPEYQSQMAWKPRFLPKLF
jgi:methyltransferase